MTLSRREILVSALGGLASTTVPRGSLAGADELDRRIRELADAGTARRATTSSGKTC